MTKHALQLMDVTGLKAVITDLSSKILPSRFEKALQPEPNSLCIGLRTLSGLTWIEMSWFVEAPRLVEKKLRSNDGAKSTLATQIQYGLKNLALVEIKQDGFERIVHFGFAKNPKEPVEKKIILELMGRHSNLFFIDSNKKIITLGKKIKQNQSRLRPLGTGDKYCAPPSLKGIKPSLCESFSNWKRRLTVTPVSLKKALQETYQGISPSLVLQLANEERIQAIQISELKVDTISEENWELIYKRWQAWIQSIQSKEKVIYFDGPTDYRVWKLNIINKPDLDVAIKLNSYYKEKLQIRKINKLTDQIHGSLSRLKKVELEYLKKQNELDILRMNDEAFKDKADRLLCLKNPTKDEIKKAQTLYKKSKKLKRSKQYIKERIKFHKERLSRIEESYVLLESIISINSISNNDTIQSLIELQDELNEYLIKSQKIQKRFVRTKSIKSNHLEVLSPSGVVVQIGKNHKQNEFISFEKARRGDLWFHAQEIPGSHVILKGSNKAFNEEDIQFAADFAAFFSKGRGSKNSAVVMAKTVHLKRIPGSTPGTLTFREGETLWGKSDRALKHMAAKSNDHGLLS